jgi:hypothetical protein
MRSGFGGELVAVRPPLGSGWVRVVGALRHAVTATARPATATVRLSEREKQRE